MQETLTAALEREHQEIDAGLEAFADGLESGELRGADLDRAADALRRHIYLEEEFLFPPLRAAGMVPPVLVMLREHGEIWRTLDALELEVGPGTAAAGLARNTGAGSPLRPAGERLYKHQSGVPGSHGCKSGWW